MRQNHTKAISQAIAAAIISSVPITEVDSKRAAGAREYATDKNYAVLTAMDEIAKNHNAPLGAIALGWLRAQPTVSAPIASARTVPQLEEIIQVVELSSAEVEKLSALSA